jgi:zinc protease
MSRFLATALAVLAWSATGFAQSPNWANWPSEGPPRPLPAHDVSYPPYEVRTLPNGLQVVAVLHHEQPAVSIRMLVRAGAAQDPAGKPGVATLAASLLDQGTTTRNARQIADTIDTIGGAMGAGSGADLTFINAVVMKDSFDLALNLMSEVVRNPAFAPEEIERQRQQLLSSLRVSYEDPDYIAGVVFDRLVYGFHPYGLPNSGTPASIAAITRDDLITFHQTYFAPNNTVLAIVGDVTTKEAFEGVERVFGNWARKEVPEPRPTDPPDPTRRLIVIDKPGAVQTEIRVGHVGIPRKHPDYMALNLAVKILGGEGSNRLHRVLRTERGLTYSASADMEALKTSGEIVAETDTQSPTSVEALRLIVDEFWNLQRERVDERELADAQAYLAGSFPLTIETPDAIAMQILNALFYGLDPKEVETYRERMNAVSVDDIQRVARAYLRPDRLSIVLVGDAAAFADELQGGGFGQYERVAVGDLDLSAADFRRASAGAPAKPAARAPALPIAAVPADEAARARKLLDRAIIAKGGLEKLQAIKTVTASSATTLVTPDGPVQADTVTYIEYPDRFRVEAQLPMGEVVQTYAAGEAWIKNPAGIRSAPPEVTKDFEQSVKRDLIPLLLSAARGELTVRPVAGKEPASQAVEVSAPDLTPVTLDIDAVTGFVTRQAYTSTGPSGEQLTEELFSDYRPVDGLLVAFKALVKRDGATVIERLVKDYRYNVSLDPALFKKPS